MYLIKTEFVKLRRCNILWVGIITLLCAPLLSILQQQSLNDPVDNYGYVNLVNGTIWNNMSFFLPVTLMLLGGYMISREYTDDTLKEIFIIPLSYSKLMAGKIGALLILSVFYSFYSFVLTTGLSILFYPIGLTGIAIIKALLQICGMGLCICISIMPFVKAKLFCPEIAGLFCRIAGLFCHDSRANLSLKPVCFGIAIS